jgi:hypothetical protein
MAQANGSGDGGDGTYHEAAISTGRLLAGRAFRRTGFWAAVGLPFVAVGLVAIQPHGWLPLLAAVFCINLVALLTGHCYDREC